MRALSAVLALVLLAPSSVPAREDVQECDGNFQLVANFGVGTFTGLGEIDALDSTEVWAVGGYRRRRDPRVLVVRWDGVTWKRVPPPTTTRGELYLTDLDVIGPDDVWVSGIRNHAFESPRFYRWDGVSWARMPMEELPPGASVWAMHVISPTDAWAVGEVGEEEGQSETPNTLTLHWDGTVWSRVEAPSPGYHASLWDVTAASGSDVWALGGGTSTPFVLHWDGTEWTRVTVPQPPDRFYRLVEADAVTSSDAWAVGHDERRRVRALAMHWNGSEWSQVTVPQPGGYEFLNGVDAVSATDAWAVGDHAPTRINRSYAQRWNGTEWSLVDVERVPGESELGAVSALPDGRAWAVGTSFSGDSEQTATIHHACTPES